MNRIDAKFGELKDGGRVGLVGYMTAGDPDEETSERNIRIAVENGLDLLELGVPFSDATADGPVIQAASRRALESGMNVSRAIAMAGRIRRDYDLPIVLFGYANPFFRHGYEKLCFDAAAAGIDGLLVVDIAYEESGELRECARRHGLYLVPLIAPTTDADRAKLVLEQARGFVYYIMVTGVTGMREQTAVDVEEHVNALRHCTDLPIAVGFGIKNGIQAARASKYADAVVVGSALVQAAGTGNLDALVRDISKGLSGRQ